MEKHILNYFKEEDKNILSQKSQEIKIDEISNAEIQDLIQDLKDTLHSNNNAKGIAAIQIGIPKKICICYWDNKEIVMINPIITRTRGETIFEEGCLSVPGILKKVERAQKVWCEYYNEQGKLCEIAEGGRMSNIIQHELDHFEGICKVL